MIVVVVMGDRERLGGGKQALGLTVSAREDRRDGVQFIAEDANSEHDALGLHPIREATATAVGVLAFWFLDEASTVAARTNRVHDGIETGDCCCDLAHHATSR
ncbi:hypothetical protein QBK99_11140 [Corticibacterium sp. UT-5YL-CI-8]|nr:hypothetical protein [Tianweitania sp. UT-5YL-CI-8]